MKRTIKALAVCAAMLLAFVPAVKAQCDDGAKKCNITVVASDALGYNDGWGDAVLEVYQGSSLLGTIDMYLTESETETYEVCEGGGDVKIVFVDEGYSTVYYDELLVEVYDATDELLASIDDIDESSSEIYSFTPSCSGCFKPTGLTMTSTEDEVTISWESNPDCEGYVYRIGTSQPLTGSWTFTTSTSVSESADEFGFYYAEVRTYCGDGDTSGAVEASVKVGTALALPFFDDFESYSSDDDVFDAEWSFFNPNNNYPQLYSYQGGKTLYMQAYYAGTGGKMGIMSPDLMMGSGNYTVSFLAAGASNQACNNVVVGWVPAGESTLDNLTELGTFSVANGTYEEFEFNLTGLNDGDKFRVVIVEPYSYAYGVIIDDFYVGANTCPKPTDLTVTDLTSTGATVSWTGAEGTGEWMYRIGSAEEPADEWTTTTDASVTFDELENNTDYTFEVFTSCGEETSKTVSIKFHTLCEVSIPYSENFESFYTVASGYSSYAYPYCWTTFSGTNNYPYAYNYGSNANSGSRVLYFYTYYGGVIAAPGLTFEGDEEVWFYMRNSSTTTITTLYVGYIPAGASDLTDYVAIDTLNAVADNQWHLCHVALEDKIPEGDWSIVLRNKTDYSYSYIYVDDFEITPKSNCPYPEGLATVNTVISGEVELEWTSEADSWQIAYGPAGFNVNGSEATIVDASSIPFIVDGLDDDTDYDFYVRGVCGDENSRWSEPVKGVRPNTYRSDKSGVDTVTGCGFTVVDDGGYTGYHSKTNRTFVIHSSEPEMALNLEGKLQLGYYYYYPNQVSKLTIYDGIGTTGVKLLDIFSQDTTFDIQSQGEYVTVVFSGSSCYYTGQGYEFEVTCVEPSVCANVSGVQMGDIYGSKAFVKWEVPTEPESYELELTDVASGAVSTISFTDAEATHSYMIDGLNERSDYTLRLRSVCAEGNGKTSPVVAFTTKCDVGGDAYIGNSSTANSDYYVHCYTYGGNDYSTGEPNRYTSQFIILASELDGMDTITGYSFFNANSYGGSTDPDVVIIVDTTSLSAYSTSYNPSFLPVDSSHIVYQGTMTQNTGRNDVVFTTPYVVPDPEKNLVVTVIHDNTDGSYYKYGYTKYTPTTGNAYRNAYQSVDLLDEEAYASYSYAYARVPNIEFHGPCGSLDCAAPAVSLNNVTTNTASFSVMAIGTATSWVVSYREKHSNNWVVFDNNFSGSTLTITGLNSGTEYVARVQTVCNESKMATRTVEFTTECDKVNVPFAAGGSSLTLPQNSTDITPCWTRNMTSSVSTYYPYNYTYYNSLYFYNYYGPALVTPKINANLNECEVEVIYHVGGSNYAIEVGYCTDPDDRTTFVPVDTVYATSTTLSNVYVSLESVPENVDGYVYFRGDNSIGGSFYLDSLRIDYRPTCADLASAEVVDVTSNSISVKLTDELNRGSYRFYYSTDGKLDVNTTPYISSTTAEAVITGLTSNTVYSVWAVADCGDEGVSHAVGLGDTRTLCDIQLLSEDKPYTLGFEANDDIDCISLYLYGDYPAGNMYLSTSDGYYHSGKQGMYFYSSIGGKSAFRTMLPTFDCSEAGDSLEFSFWYRMPDGGSISVEYRLGDSGEWTPLGSEDYMVSTWNRASYDLSFAKGKPVVQVSVNVVGENYHYIYFDDFTIGRRERCVPPSVKFTDITEHDAKATWYDPINDEHRLEYRGASGFTWTVKQITDGVSEGIISPLTFNTSYSVRIASVCENDSLSDYNNYVLVTPDCEHFALYTNADENAEQHSVTLPIDNGNAVLEWIVPASEFEGVTSFDKIYYVMDSAVGPGSYTYLYITATDDDAVNDTIGHTYTDSYYYGYLNFKKGENVLELNKAFTVPEGKNIAFALQYGNNSTGADSIYFHGHASTNGSLMVTSDNGSNYYVYTTYINGSYSYYSDHYIYKKRYIVPDISVKQCQQWCYAPVLNTIATTATTLTVRWVYENRPVQVAIRKAGDSQWGDWVNVTGANLYTFTGLQYSTDYEVRLRCDCNAYGIGYTDEVYGYGTTDFLCSVPSNITVTDVTAHSATITWTDGDIHSDKWDLFVSNDGFEKYYTATAKPFTITGLLPGNDYKVQVRAYCGDDYSMVGDWSEVRHIQNTCAPVTGVSATNNGDDVTVSWNAGDRNKKWLVAYGVKDFDDNEAIEIRTVTENHTTFEGLKRGSTYSFRVRAFCDDDWASVWSADANVSLVGIDDVDGEASQITLQPNPATSFVTLGLESVEGTATVTILSVDGRQLQQFTAGEGSVRVDLSQYASGTYYVRVQTDEWTATRKLIVK